MKIGPVDIRNHVFSRRKMRGVDEAEVAAYLDLVADRLEEAVLESDDLRARIDQLERDLEEYRKLDRTLRDSLLSAERLADGRLEQTEREARIIVKNAEVEAEKVIATAQAEAASIRGTLDDLRRQRLTYVERFRALLRSQMKILEASVESFDPELDDVERTLDRIEGSSPERPAPPRVPFAAPPPPPERSTPESASSPGAADLVRGAGLVAGVPDVLRGAGGGAAVPDAVRTAVRTAVHAVHRVRGGGRTVLPSLRRRSASRGRLTG